MSVPENSMILRSNCRAHGADCSCSDELTLQKRRSISRTPSRASSVQPELCMSSEPSALNLMTNGTIRSLDFQNHHSLDFQSNRSSSRFQVSNSVDTDFSAPNYRRSISRTPSRASSVHPEELYTPTTKFSSSQSSKSSTIHSSRSNTSHMTIRQNVIETDTTTLLKNGNHQRLHSVTYCNKNVAENQHDDSSNSLSISKYDEHYDEQYGYRSKISTILTSVQSGLMFLPRLIYWSLVHLFVCEKWLLHRTASFSTYNILRNLLLLGLLLFFGTCLYNSWPENLSTTVFGRLNSPIFSGEMPHGIPSCQQQQCPPPDSSSGNAYNNAEYQKLLDKIAYLEQKMNDYRQTAENTYTHNLNILEQNLNVKFKEEVSKIEPTKVIVEKHFLTTVEKEVVQLPPVIQPAPEPEPIDPEKLSKMILPLILPEMLEKLKADLANMIKVNDSDHKKSDLESVVPHSSAQLDLNLTDIEKMIRAAIEKYDADKTGLPDLALEPAGGSILSTRCTKSSPSKNSVLTVWGWRIWSFRNSPRSIIQPGVVPGECWFVEGATAEVVIQLVSPAVITGFTLEHIPKAISPYGKIDTAPKEFQVVGLMSENDMDTIWDYGTFQYEDNGQPIQYFPVQKKTVAAYPIVELKVLSNHGSVKSTCIYRFRVHGEKIGWK